MTSTPNARDDAPTRAVRLCGAEAINSPNRRLAAGPLTVELENGQLRYASFAGIEALRGVAFLVRDENWGTTSHFAKTTQ